MAASSVVARVPTKMKFIDLRATYDLFLIDKFYSDIIMANFPIEDERDDLEWFQNGLLHTAPEYLDPKDPLLFVIIAMAPLPTNPNEKFTFENCGSTQVDKDLPIAGAIAFEYFKRSNCGLVTYIVTQPEFNRRGIARRLMELAYEKLNQVSMLSRAQPSISRRPPQPRTRGGSALLSLLKHTPWTCVMA